MNDDRQHVRVVLGMAGYGKSSLTRQLIAGAERLVALDPKEEYDALALSWDDFCAYVDRMPLDRFRVSCLEADRGEEVCAIAYAVGEIVAERSGARVTVLLEEADLVAPPGREPAAFKKLVAQGRMFTGRRGGIDLITVVRRPPEISKLVRAMMNELYIFRTQDADDLVELRGFIGDDAAALVAAFKHPTDNGGIAEYVHWTPRSWTRGQLAVGG
jgi:hypothetical protein